MGRGVQRGDAMTMHCDGRVAVAGDAGTGQQRAAQRSAAQRSEARARARPGSAGGVAMVHV